MRIITSALLVASLFASNAFAATDSIAPPAAPAAQSTGALAPGKPAGVQKAQGSDNTVWWILGAGVVIGSIVLVATGNNNNTPTNSTTLTQ